MVANTQDLPTLPAIVDGFISHHRRGPIDHHFRHRIYQWLIDVDQIPRMPWYLRPVGGFAARDHLGGSGPDSSDSIKTNVERFLACCGVDLGPRGRVIMLANARVLGHVFDPLTVFWCFGSGGELRCLVAEVHNTYGEQHAYLLTPDVNGETGADKQMYVSPFYDVSGHYSMKFTLDRHHVRVSISLVRAEHTVFDALFAGVPIPASPRTVARFALRMPAMPQKVSALIRAHGIGLWMRRLAIVDRPHHSCQEGV